METFDPDFFSTIQLHACNEEEELEEAISVEQLLYDPLKLLFSINSEGKEATLRSSSGLLASEEGLYGMWYWLRRSRTYWYGQMARKLPSETPPRAIHEKVSGMLQRQELIYLKAILDHLSKNLTNPKYGSTDNASIDNGSTDNANQEVIFIFINQALVDSPGLIKEVHRAEFLYDARLIPSLVEKVPAMHAAIEAAHALSTNELEDIKEHGELLLAHLALHYPSPKTLHFAKLLLKSVNPTLRHTVQVLALVSLAFPDLIPESRAVLQGGEHEKTFDSAVQTVNLRLQLPIYYPPKAPDFSE